MIFSSYVFIYVCIISTDNVFAAQVLPRALQSYSKWSYVKASQQVFCPVPSQNNTNSADGSP